jgi:hypothetical protein
MASCALEIVQMERDETRHTTARNLQKCTGMVRVNEKYGAGRRLRRSR